MGTKSEVAAGSRKLEGKVAVITGAGRGIGRALAIAFAAEGAAVGCLARTRQELDRVVAEIKGKDGRALALPTDVTDFAAVTRAVDRTAKEFRGLDIVVANAGVAPDPRSLVDSDPDFFMGTLNVNVFGVYATLRAAVLALAATGTRQHDRGRLRHGPQGLVRQRGVFELEGRGVDAHARRRARASRQ